MGVFIGRVLFGILLSRVLGMMIFNRLLILNHDISEILI
jgi:hypothetical protein